MSVIRRRYQLQSARLLAARKTSAIANKPIARRNGLLIIITESSPHNTYRNNELTGRPCTGLFFGR